MALLWGVVAYIVLFVDPSLIKDVGVPGLYLPFLLSVGVASWYTFALLSKRGWGALVLTLLVVLSLFLAIVRLMYPLLAIGLLLLSGFIVYLTFIH